MPTTKIYDFHAQYEHEYDETPALYVYKVAIDKDGLWYADTQANLSYRFSEEETAEVLDVLKSSNSGIDTLADLYWDEWFSSEDFYIRDTLPKTVLAWIDALPEYEYETY